MVQYILEVIEDPIIWNVSLGLNWGGGVKCSSSFFIFRDVYLVILFRKYELPQAYKRYLFGCVLWFVSPTSEHQLPTWSVWIQVNVLAGAELVGVCSVTWSYPKVDLKRGKWFQVLLMVRHGAKWWSRYIGSSQQGSHTSDLRLQKNYITRPDAGKHLALSFTRKKKNINSDNIVEVCIWLTWPRCRFPLVKSEELIEDRRGEDGGGRPWQRWRGTMETWLKFNE